MILLDRNDADRLIIGIRQLLPILPEYMLEIASLFEEQLINCNCEEALLLQISTYINKYIMKKDSHPKRKKFFEQKDCEVDDNDLIAREIVETINVILLEQSDKQNRNYQVVRR